MVKIFSNVMASELIKKASLSSRGRSSTNLHVSSSDPCQKLFNAIGINSYIQPHRHSLDPKTEFLIAIKGLFALLIFDDMGVISRVIRFGSEKYANDFIGVGVELQSNIWHTVIPLVEGSIIFECKAGPFNPRLAKELASWAPSEESEAALEYFHSLKNICNTYL